MKLTRLFAAVILIFAVTQAKATTIALGSSSANFPGANEHSGGAFGDNFEKHNSKLLGDFSESSALFELDTKPLTFNKHHLESSPLMANPDGHSGKLSGRSISLPEPGLLTMLFFGLLCLGAARRYSKQA